MKLIIHCGFHKTATTSFQKLCTENRSLLRRVGLHYPAGEVDQHSFMMHLVQQKGVEAISPILRGIHSDAAGCHSVLISGEDFENCIVDVALASEIESIAHASGFASVTWLIVTREGNEGRESLYGEISKHGAVVSRRLLQQVARSRGCLYVTSAHANHIFVLDYSRFSTRFKRATSGDVNEWPFEEFVRDYPGAVVLKTLLADEEFARFERSAVIHRKKLNSQFNGRQIEANYIATALGLEYLRRRRVRFLLMPLIWLRTKAHRAEHRSGN